MKLSLTKYLFIILFFLFSCSEEEIRFKNPDVSKSSVSISVKRFESDLFQMPKEELVANPKELKKQYGTFFKRYVENVLMIGSANDPAIGYALKNFTSDPEMEEVFRDAAATFPEMDSYRKELENAFKVYAFYFPGKIVPDLVTFTSGFNYSVIAMDSVLALGLDMYLGKDYKFYPMLGYPLYKTRLMSEDYLVSDAMKAWIATEFVKDEEKKDLLSQIVYEGKIAYLQDVLLPEIHDTIKMGFSSRQLQWCVENEFPMWIFFIDNKLLYTSNHMEIMKYVGEGPFTNGFDKESPARAAIWMGWQIVKKYMDNNPKITLNDLMMQQDAQLILARSKYKPR